jgi:hypothetical protein
VACTYDQGLSQALASSSVAGALARRALPRRPSSGAAPALPAATTVAPLDAANTLNGNPLPTPAAAYVFHYTLATFDEAQETCACDGGHLAAYFGEGQQASVENYFVNLGVLLPEYDPVYWIGLNTTTGDRSSPDWMWVDPVLGRPQAHRHWGTFSYADGTQEGEPNNLNDPEECGVCNYTERFTKATKLDAKVTPFGWADERCGASHQFMCRVATGGVAPRYTANSTNVTYYLNTTQVNFTVAGATCNRFGGHLAAFTQIDEQLEVEQNYVKTG